VAWTPHTAEELITALGDGTLPHESAYYEYKQALPAPNKSSDIAIDVSAMTVDGGLIIYGIAEDKATATFHESPIALSGAQERISNTVVASVRERPAFDVRLLVLPGDSATGFVLVDVPASPRAPHQVEVRGEYRYYGRVPGGNVLLTEGEVAQLYERRRFTEDQSRITLDEAIAAAPIQAVPGERADLHLVARPLLADSGIRNRAFNDDDGSGLAAAVTETINAVRFKQPWDPNLADILRGGTRAPTLDGICLTDYPTLGSDGVTPLERYYGRLEVMDNGMIRYFRASIAEATSTGAGFDTAQFAIRDPAAGQITAHFARMVGAILRRARYQGLVDVYVAILGAKGAVSALWFMRGGGMFPTPSGVPGVPTNDYRNEGRFSLDQLIKDPVDVSRPLLERLVRIIRPGGIVDPLELQ
jgi:Schlafen, AlbA_2